MSDSVIDPELMGNVQPLAIQDKEMEAFWWFTNPQVQCQLKAFHAWWCVKLWSVSDIILFTLL